MDHPLVSRTSRLSPMDRPACIMHSLDPVELNATSVAQINEPFLCSDLESLNLLGDILENSESKSVYLLDDNERLLISSEDRFMSDLGIPKNKKIKVVSIFGNTGEGKSYTLNHAFFNGEEIFKTSPSQKSCTLGVWAMYNAKWNMLCLDTEGLLGISKKEQQRTRLLLKVLAVSDIVIFRTRAERLQRDMYSFLGGASKAYKQHFSRAFQQVLDKHDFDKTTSLGPGVIIFHETRHTDTLDASTSVTESAEDIIRESFGELQLEYDSFSYLKYVGIQTRNQSTSFKELQVAVQKELESTEIRSPRDAKYIYLTLKCLNEKFQSRISETRPEIYLSAFFTCQDKCSSCRAGCTLSMGHKDEGEPHFTNKKCEFQHQFQNCVYLCKKCYLRGEKIVVTQRSVTEDSWSNLFNYVWSGYSIVCKKCGEIYRSRQHWYGNKDPEESAVIPDIVHVWPGDKHYFQENTLLGSQNAAQKVLDSVTQFSDTVASYGSQPTRVVSNWVTDQIAPSYWRPNNEIKECFKCKTTFPSTSTKHHCRSCGEGFCELCSSNTMPVPAQGWTMPVRVCDDCYKNTTLADTEPSHNNEILVRQLGESVLNSMQVVKSVLSIPKTFIKDTARPSYWTPDHECVNCSNCERPFGLLLILHHCRECGKGVCDDCSNTRKPVPLRGWDTPVRVCDNCLCN